MNEPIYEFVKGKGWLIVTDTVTLACGTCVKVEIRKPENGESYFDFSPGSTFDTWSTAERLKYLAGGYFRHYALVRPNTHLYATTMYAVMVPV